MASPIEAYTASHPVPGRRASYKISLVAGYLRAQLHDHGTMEGMQMFLNTVACTGKVLACGRFFISVDTSIPLSMDERSAFSVHLNQLGASPEHKVAVVGTSLHPGNVDECIEPLAQRPNVRGFSEECAAVQWVRNRRQAQDRRRGQTVRPDRPLRLGQGRRYGQVNEWTI